MTAYESELAKTRKDIAALELISGRNPLDPEKRIRLAYRQYHQASLSNKQSAFKTVKQAIAEIIRDFGPKEDICLLKANIDGHFHCLAEVKKDLEMCPALARRFAGRSILADIDLQEGRYDRGFQALEELIQENQTWDNLARLAHWKGKMGYVAEADRLFAEAGQELTAKELRSFAWIEVQRGSLMMSRGQYDTARLHLERAAKTYPGHWHTEEHLAGLMAATGDYKEALDQLQNVIARVPKPELKQACGELLLFLGRVDEARPWLDSAVDAYLLSAREGDVHYYHHLADYYADAGNQPEEAVKWARKDVGLRSNFSTQSALAWALFQNGEMAEGLEWIGRALSSGVQDGGIFATASALFHANGDTTQGEQFARAAENINPNGHSFHLHH